MAKLEPWEDPYCPHSYTSKELDDLAKRYYAEGWVLTRVEYPWGQTPMFKNKATHQIRYYWGGRLLPGAKIREFLKTTWRPVEGTREWEEYEELLNRLLVSNEPPPEAANKVVDLRMRAKRGEWISPSDMRFLESISKDYPEWYDRTDAVIFERTKPFGSDGWPSNPGNPGTTECRETPPLFGGDLEALVEKASVTAAELTGSKIARQVAQELSGQVLHSSPLSPHCQTVLNQPPRCWDFRGIRAFVMCQAWDIMEKEKRTKLPVGEAWAQARKSCVMERPSLLYQPTMPRAQITDLDKKHKLAKVYNHGRVYAAIYAEPYPTEESALQDYRDNPRSYRPFDESSGKFLA